MKALSSLFALGLIVAPAQAQDLYVYENFNSYTPQVYQGTSTGDSGWDGRTNLVNLITGAPVYWYHANNSGTNNIIQVNDLAVYTSISRAGGLYPQPGLDCSSSNLMYTTGGANTHLKGVGVTNGSIYFSCLWHADQGSAFAGGNNGMQVILGWTTGESGWSGGTTSSNSTTFHYKLCGRTIPDGGGNTYFLGVFKGTNNTTINSNSLNGQWVFSKPLDRGSIHFIVGCYQINSGTNLVDGAVTNDDIVSLWIDPDRSTFGAAAAPQPDAGGMLTNWAPNASPDEFAFRSNQEPASKRIADLRLGRTWASVTPKYYPTLKISNSPPDVAISWPAKDSFNGFGYKLTTASDLTTSFADDSNTPTLDGTGTNNVVTETANSPQFWRLFYPPRSGVFGQY